MAGGGSLFESLDGEQDPWSLPTPKTKIVEDSGSQNNYSESHLSNLLSDVQLPEWYEESWREAVGGTGEDQASIDQLDEALNRLTLKDDVLSAVKNLLSEYSVGDDGRIDHGSWNTILALGTIARDLKLSPSQVNLDAVAAHKHDLSLHKFGGEERSTSIKESNGDNTTSSFGGATNPWGVGIIQTDPLSVGDLPAVQDTQFPEDQDQEIDNYENNEVLNSFNPLTRDTYKVTVVPEKAGLIFRHVNYMIERTGFTTSDDQQKVLRRYSDFVWLLESLLSKYPFRMVPDLPPKKFTGGSMETVFLERRRKGLARFLNILSKHPILSKEAIVNVFLTVPTELSVWRKQATIDLAEEFTGRKISRLFIDRWQAEEEATWQETRNSLSKALESWNRICVLIERIAKRQESLAQDFGRFSQSLKDFTESAPYMPSPTFREVKSGMHTVSVHVENETTFLFDESHGADGILEDFKTYRDYLVQLKNLLDRYFEDRDADPVPKLSRRIANYREELSRMSSKPDVKGMELERVKQAIAKDEAAIQESTNRAWLIKECVRTEFSLFQATAGLISKTFQEWASDRSKYSELGSENWSKLVTIIEDMPLQ